MESLIGYGSDDENEEITQTKRQVRYAIKNVRNIYSVRINNDWYTLLNFD